MTLSNRFRTGVVILAGISTLSLLVLWRCNRNAEHLILLNDMQLGSGPSALKRVIDNSSVYEIEFVRWERIRDASDPRDRVQTDFGRFHAMPIPESSDAIRNFYEDDSFSGQVRCYMVRFIEDGVVMVFTYVDGRLVNKDYGYLPG